MNPHLHVSALQFSVFLAMYILAKAFMYVLAVLTHETRFGKAVAIFA